MLLLCMVMLRSKVRGITYLYDTFLHAPLLISTMTDSTGMGAASDSCNHNGENRDKTQQRHA